MADQVTKTSSPLLMDLNRRNQEPEWMAQLRESAWEEYDSMPSPRLEKTDLTRRSWDVGPFPAAVNGTPSAEASALKSALMDAPVVQVQDGIVISVNLPQRLADQGIIFCDLERAVHQHPDLVRSHLTKVVPASDSKWAALSAALWHGGVFLYVPRRVTVDEPFLFLYTETPAGNGALPRVLVVAEEQSSVHFVDVYLTEGELASGKVHAAVAEVVAKSAANVKVSSVHRLVSGPTHYVVRRADVGNDASVDWVMADVSDGFTVGLLESVLRGSGSKSTTQAVALGYGRQRLDFTANMEHIGRYSESDIKLYGVLRQRANSLFRSSTHIYNGAVAAGSEQSDRMLLLDTSSRADAIPMLLIDENDVQRCGHAASVGRIDPAQIFYLMSRGIPEGDAVRMVVWGYLYPTVQAFPIAAVRELVTKWIDRELE